MSIGQVPWSKDEIIAAIPEFLKIYAQRPIDVNKSGMRSPHMFATWFMIKKLQPSAVIESGVLRGQGTWIIDKAVPNAKLFCIEPNVETKDMAFLSPNGQYFKKDFTKIPWDEMGIDKSNTLVFIDDHMNAFARIKQAKERGFTHMIFEDNYPVGRGDCYSLKKAFAEAGYQPKRKKDWKNRLRRIIYWNHPRFHEVKANADDAKLLREWLEVYREFPPVFKPEHTRWKDAWTDERYPTEEPVFGADIDPQFSVFKDDAKNYSFICYAKLKA